MSDVEFGRAALSTKESLVSQTERCAYDPAMGKKNDLWKLGTNAAMRLMADTKPKTREEQQKQNQEIICFRAGWIVGFRAAMRSRSK